MIRGQATLTIVLVHILLVGSLVATPYTVSVLNGDSMEPAADSCDIMLVDQSQDSLGDFEEGDWVRFESQENVTIVHNVRYVDANFLTTKGVNNSKYDEVVWEDKIRGKVIGHLETPDCDL